jgi:hypothetical protein
MCSAFISQKEKALFEALSSAGSLGSMLECEEIFSHTLSTFRWNSDVGFISANFDVTGNERQIQS